MAALQSLVVFLASIIGVFLALLLLLVFIVSPLVIACRNLWSLYRSSRRKIVHHQLFGDMEVYDNDAQVNVRLAEKQLCVELPASAGTPSAEALEVLAELSRQYESLESVIGMKAIEEWKNLSDSYNSDEDRELVERLKPMMNDPRLFLRTFTLERLEIVAPDREVRLEYLPPWDPEHTRLAVFDWSLQMKRYGLSCGM